MPARTSVFEIADVALLAAGTLLIIVGAVVLSVRRRWREAFALPPAPPNRLELLDVFLALLVMFFLPVLVAQVLAPFYPAPSETQLSTGQLMKASPPQVLGDMVSKLLALFVLLALGRSRFAGGLAGWGLTAAGCPRRLFQAFQGLLVACPVCYGLLELSGLTLRWLNVQYEQHASIEALRDASAPAGLHAMIVVNALLLAPVVEELFFRGLLIPAPMRWGQSRWGAVVISSILFGLIHYSYLDTIPPLVAFGVLLGYLYVKTGSLTLVILLHAFFNGKTLLWLVLGANYPSG